MKKSMVKMASAVVAAVGSLLFSSASFAEDLTSSLEFVDNPTYRDWKNNITVTGIADLQFYRGKLYPGVGEVELNPGPVPVYSIDPYTKLSVKEFTAGTEQLSRFCIASWGEMFVGSEDPHEGSMNEGDVFVRDADGNWRFYKSFKGSMPYKSGTSSVLYNTHVWSVVEFDGACFLSGYGLGRSTNRFVTVEDVSGRNGSGYTYNSWAGDPLRREDVYLVYPNNLFVIPRGPIAGVKMDNQNGHFEVGHYDKTSGQFVLSHQHVNTLWPGVASTDYELGRGTTAPSSSTDFRVYKPTSYKDRVVYILSFDTLAGNLRATAYPIPVAGYTSVDDSGSISATRISFGGDNKNYPFDFTIDNGILYALTSKYMTSAEPDKKAHHIVWKSTDGVNFTEVLSFDYCENMISLEYHDGYFYFGVGCANYAPGFSYSNANNAGSVYRIRCPQEPVQIETSVSELELSRGGSAAMTVKLSAQPSETTVVKLAPMGAVNGLTTDHETLTFTTANWNTPQSVQVSIAADAGVGAGNVTLLCGVSGDDVVHGEFGSSGVTSAEVGVKIAASGEPSVPHEHVWSPWVTNAPPTETHEGVRSRSCIAAGCSTPVVTETETIPMLGAPAPISTPTAIPDGRAVYDVELYITSTFKELDEYSNWPLEMNFLLGETIYGHRKSVEKINDYWTKITYRCAMDIGAMIAYSKTSAYTDPTVHQSKLYLLDRAVNTGNTVDVASWTSGNVAFDFSGVTTVEGFVDIIAENFICKPMSTESTLAGNTYSIEMPSKSIVINEMRFKYVSAIPAAPSGESLYEVAVTFHTEPTPEVGKLQIQYQDDIVFDFKNMKVSDDGRTFSMKTKLDIADLIAKNNAHTTAYQPKVVVNGSTRLMTGSNIVPKQIAGNTPYDLANTIEQSFLFRDSTGASRFVGFTIKPTEADPEPETVYTDIHNAAEFKAAMAAGDYGAYRLMNSIDLAGSGYVSAPVFKGTFNGNGKTITGLGAQPLCVTNQGEIASFTIDGAGTERSGSGIGVVCDTLDGGTITNCIVKGYTLKCDVVQSGRGNGLLAGLALNGSKIIGCTTAADCTVTENSFRDNYMGGLIGLVNISEAGNAMKIIDSTNNAAVVATGDWVSTRGGAGGFVGRVIGGNKGVATIHILRCVNFGTVSSVNQPGSNGGGATANNVGGFVGFVNAASGSPICALIEDSFNSGAVVADDGATNAGGFIATLYYWAFADIERSANLAAVGGAKTDSVGGFIGCASQPNQSESITIRNSANYGAITGRTVGGLVGTHALVSWAAGADMFANSANYGTLTGSAAVGQILGTATVNSTVASPTLTIKIDNCWTLDSTLTGATVGEVTKTNNKDASVADNTALAALNSIAGSNSDYGTWHIGETTHPELTFAKYEEPEEPEEPPEEPEEGDLTASLVNLGIPHAGRYPTKYYARNPWDLKAFEGRLYIGSGNSANEGPETNSGPVDIMCYDPETGTYTNELTILEEQIDAFRILDDGGLYIPGHDPRGSGGGLFIRAKNASGPNVWQEFKSNFTGIEHCYDVTMFDGKLIASGNEIWMSPDTSAANLAKFSSYTISGRRYSMLVFPNALYAIGTATIGGKVGQLTYADTFGIDRLPKGGSFAAVNNAGTDKSPKANRDYVFPDLGTTAVKDGFSAKHPISIGERVVYIGGLLHNDHQMLPVAAYSATDGEAYFTATKIALPEGAVPWDTMLYNGKAYLLWTTKSGDKFVNHVSESSDGLAFTELFHFTADSFARSFEYLGGKFYFGLGAENVDIFDPHSTANNSLLSAASGTILSCPYDLGEEEPDDPPEEEECNLGTLERVQVYTEPGNYTFTVPLNIDGAAKILVVGGGVVNGAGGEGISNNAFTMAPGSVWNVTVGAAGQDSSLTLSPTSVIGSGGQGDAKGVTSDISGYTRTYGAAGTNGAVIIRWSYTPEIDDGDEKTFAVTLTPDRADGRYLPNETVTYTFGGKVDDGPIPDGQKFRVTWSAGKEQISETEYVYHTATPTISFVVTKAANYRLRAMPLQPNGDDGVQSWYAPQCGVVCDFDNITKPMGDFLPSDFDEWWEGELAAQREKTFVEGHLDMSKVVMTPYNFQGCTPEQIATYQGRSWWMDAFSKTDNYDVRIPALGTNWVAGGLSMPKDTSKKYPAIINFYGVGWDGVCYCDPNGANSNQAIEFYVNAHGLPEGANWDEDYQNMRAAIENIAKSQGWNTNYELIGKGQGRDNVYYRHVFLRAAQAVEFIKQLPQWDGKTLIVNGRSQGSAQSVAAAALAEGVTHLFLGISAMCDFTGEANDPKRPESWPFNTRASVHPESDYFDCVNFAHRITGKKVSMIFGLTDDLCPATGPISLYNALKGNNTTDYKSVAAKGHDGAWVQGELNPRANAVLKGTADPGWQKDEEDDPVTPGGDDPEEDDPGDTTVIPSGLAEYDLTLAFSRSFTNFTQYGKWPMIFDAKLGTKLYGQRLSVSPEGTSVTYRVTADLASMIEYSKSETYSAANKQMKIFLLPNTLYPADASELDIASWTSLNAAVDFAGVETVGGFGDAIMTKFGGDKGKMNTTTSLSDGHGGRNYYSVGDLDPVLRLTDLDFRFVKAVSPAPNMTTNYEVAVTFNNAPAETITKIRIQYQDDIAFDLVNPVASADGCTYTSVLPLNIAELIAMNNVHTDKYQTKLYINGSATALCTGSLIAAPQIAGNTAFDLADAVEGRIRYLPKTADAPYRFVGFTIRPTEAAPVDPPEEPEEHTHVWGEWYTNVVPTVEHEGELRRDCTASGCTDPVACETQVLPKLEPPEEPPEDPEDDSIPDGLAEYDITFTVDNDLPNMSAYGDWPVVFDFRLDKRPITLSQSISADRKTVTVRVAMDVKAMIDYSRTTAYASGGHQSKIYLLYNYMDIYNPTMKAAGFTSQNIAFDFTGVTKVSEFSAVISPRFAAYDYGPMTMPEGDTTKQYKIKDFEIAFVKTIPAAASGEKDYDVSVSFNNPLADVGFATVTKIELVYPDLFTIAIDAPLVSDNRYTGQTKLDVPAMIAQINGETYRAKSNSQPRLNVYGTDANGAATNEVQFIGSSSCKVSEISGTTADELADALFVDGKFRFRYTDARCRFTGLTIVESAGREIELVAPEFRTDGGALFGIVSGDGGEKAFKITVDNPVVGAAYTVFTSTEVNGAYTAEADSTVYVAGDLVLEFAVDPAIPQKFAKIVVSLEPYHQGDPLE